MKAFAWPRRQQTGESRPRAVARVREAPNGVGLRPASDRTRIQDSERPRKFRAGARGSSCADARIASHRAELRSHRNARRSLGGEPNHDHIRRPRQLHVPRQLRNRPAGRARLGEDQRRGQGQPRQRLPLSWQLLRAHRGPTVPTPPTHAPAAGRPADDAAPSLPATKLRIRITWNASHGPRTPWDTTFTSIWERPAHEVRVFLLD